MHHRLLVHLVWTTRDRAPSINLARAHYLAGEFIPLALRERARVLEIGIVSTHLHLLLGVHTSTNLPRMLQRMKGGTARVVNRERIGAGTQKLRWGGGYSATSVSHQALDRVADYVRNQHRRHPSEAIPGFDAGAIASAIEVAVAER